MKTYKRMVLCTIRIWLEAHGEPRGGGRGHPDFA